MENLFGSSFPPDLLRLTWYVYERQSSPKQVEENEGSTAYQRSIRDLLIAWGVPAGQIVELGRDLGKSGQGTAYRDDYLFLLDEIRSERPVGVAVATIHRLGRNAPESLRLLEECQIHQIPLFYDGKLCDTQDVNQLMTAQLMAVVGQYSNNHHHLYMTNCRIAKARTGKLVARCPIGIIRLTDEGSKGLPARDPDPRIQEPINAVFRSFRTYGTLRTTMLALRSDGVKLLARKKEVLIPQDPNIWRIERIIKNPLYAGTCVFRKTVADPRLGRDGKGHWKVRRATPEEQVIIHGVFEGYISWEEYLQNQERLRINGGRRAARRSAKGSPALGQGLVRCSLHPRRTMSPKGLNPRKDGSWSVAYQCQGTHLDGGSYCRCVSAGYVDALLMRAVTERIVAPRLEIIKAAYDQARGDDQAERFRLKVELLRMQEREAKVEQLCLSADPGNTYARQALEKKWDETIRERVNLQARFDSAASAPCVFDDNTRFREFIDLVSDKEQLLGLATPVELNDIVGILVEAAWVEEYSPEKLVLRIVWREGGPHLFVEARLWGWAYRRIIERKTEGATAKQIADELNAEGVITRKQLKWTERLVLAVIERQGRRPVRKERTGSQNAARAEA